MLLTALFIEYVVFSYALETQYVPEAFFDPISLNYSLLQAKTQRIINETTYFNPSLAKLPPLIKAELTEYYRSKGKTTTPTYICGFRHKDHSCKNLKSAVDPNLEKVWMKQARITGTTFWILDEHFKKMCYITNDQGHRWKFEHTDARIETKPGYGEGMLVSGTKYKHKKGQVYSMWDLMKVNLRLINSTGFVSHALSSVHHADIHGGSNLHGWGKNYGIVFEGSENSSFSILHWLTNDYVDIRRGLPPEQPHKQVGKKIIFPFGRKNHTVSNNASPISLKDGIMLGVGHFHVNSKPGSSGPNKLVKGVTKYGNTYLHVFVLFSSVSPYAHCATSRPFCLPAVDDPSKCEAIQFVMSIIRYDDDNILMSYGINDCESGRVIIPIRDILDFIYNPNSKIAAGSFGESFISDHSECAAARSF